MHVMRARLRAGERNKQKKKGGSGSVRRCPKSPAAISMSEKERGEK